MYGGERMGAGWVAYVGIAGNLHRRLEQHIVRRDSSVVTRTSRGDQQGSGSGEERRRREVRAAAPEPRAAGEVIEGLEVVAGGREDWVGWVELKTEPVNVLATRHTAMVMRDTSADILGVMEAEDRISLRDFSKVMLAKVGAQPYPHVMVIDGNDGRGIDVGILTRSGFPIGEIVSHVDDGGENNEVFSCDCPANTVTTPWRCASDAGTGVGTMARRSSRR